jgi:hypothetical protein
MVKQNTLNILCSIKIMHEVYERTSYLSDYNKQKYMQ